MNPQSPVWPRPICAPQRKSRITDLTSGSCHLQATITTGRLNHLEDGNKMCRSDEVLLARAHPLPSPQNGVPLTTWVGIKTEGRLWLHVTGGLRTQFRPGAMSSCSSHLRITSLAAYEHSCPVLQSYLKGLRIKGHRGEEKGSTPQKPWC